VRQGSLRTTAKPLRKILARVMHSQGGMRTHHLAFYVALAVGAALAVVLSAATGLWLDHYRPIGTEGILRFLGAVVLIVLAVEAAAGTFGDWIDDRIQGHHTMR